MSDNPRTDFARLGLGHFIVVLLVVLLVLLCVLCTNRGHGELQIIFHARGRRGLKIENNSQSRTIPHVGDS